MVTGFHRPYLATACLHSGLVAVSERGSEMGQELCVKILGPGWDTLRILGVCSSLGPYSPVPGASALIKMGLFWWQTGEKNIGCFYIPLKRQDE